MSNSIWNFSSVHAEESSHPKLLPTLSLNYDSSTLPIKTGPKKLEYFILFLFPKIIWNSHLKVFIAKSNLKQEIPKKDNLGHSKKNTDLEGLLRLLKK